MANRTGSLLFWGIFVLSFLTQIVYDAVASRVFYFQEKKIVAIVFFFANIYLALSMILCTHDAEVAQVSIGEYLQGWKALRLFYRPFTALWETKFEVKMFIILLLSTTVFVIMICILDETGVPWVGANAAAYVSAICLMVMLSQLFHHSIFQISNHEGWFPGNIIFFPGKEPISAGNGLRFWIHDLVLEYSEEVYKN
jgi:hypothetical protein